MIKKRIALTTLKINERTRAFPVVQPTAPGVRPSSFNITLGLPKRIGDPRISKELVP